VSLGPKQEADTPRL